MAKDHVPVRLPAQAIAMIDDLIPLGIYGDNRGEVARKLIHDRLEDLASKDVIKWRRLDADT